MALFEYPSQERITRARPCIFGLLVRIYISTPGIKRIDQELEVLHIATIWRIDTHRSRESGLRAKVSDENGGFTAPLPSFQLSLISLPTEKSIYCI